MESERVRRGNAGGVARKTKVMSDSRLQNKKRLRKLRVDAFAFDFNLQLFSNVHRHDDVGEILTSHRFENAGTR